MAISLYHVDAFTDRPFAGNPAAVCLLDGPAGTSWMQAVAAEMNLSETAFLLPLEGGWSLRWFTPAVEVDLCGHATLASAHVLTRECGIADEVLRFDTASGRISAAVLAGGIIELDFPADEPTPVPAPEGLLAALFPDVSVNDIEVAEVVRGAFDLVVVLASEADVRRCRPDLAALAAIEARGVAITAATGAPADRGPDIVSRFFGPTVGIDEDPVTGSLHCLLGPYWSPRLGRPVLDAHQASVRGGDLVVEVRGDRVALRGRAVTVSRGQLGLAAAAPA